MMDGYELRNVNRSTFCSPSVVKIILSEEVAIVVVVGVIVVI
jgi:hypothetical protein